MSDFSIAYKITMSHEGGYSNNAFDAGKETYAGISRRYYPTWNGWLIIDRHKKAPDFPNNIKGNQALQEQVFSFYKKNFWDVNKLDLFNSQEIANELFDTGVNMGHRIAAEFAQKAYNLLSKNSTEYAKIEIDGVIGQKTITAINSHARPDCLLKILNILQGAKYISICDREPSQEIFFAGWLKRVSV